MRHWLTLLLCAALAACATPPPRVQAPSHLFDDTLFAAPSERVGADEIFAVSESMRQYLGQAGFAVRAHNRGPQRALLEALYEKQELKLVYDAGTTRNAAEAFEARSGNCLSLVVMTAAFAKELGLKVSYRSALIEDIVSRSNNMLLRSGHVNITLSRRFADPWRPQHDPLTVDFLPPEDLRGLRTREITEETVVAMFMNNRAVEALIRGRMNDAYAWASGAVRSDPTFVSALNTLGVIYLRRGALTLASTVFDHALERDPVNRAALANLSSTYARMGRSNDAARLQQRLAALETQPPLHDFDLGLAAMKKQDFPAAREHFARELKRNDSSAEVHYWLGMANLALGDSEQARLHLMLAMKASPKGREREIYTAKLEQLKLRQSN